MRNILLEFNDDDATLDRIAGLSADLGITSEQWIHRAIAEHLGSYALNKLPEDSNSKSLRDLFEMSGIIKKL